MLRSLGEFRNPIGINWYLTDDDDSNDGQFKDYLNNPKMAKYDEEVFSCLKSIVDSNKNPTIQDIIILLFFSNRG